MESHALWDRPRKNRVSAPSPRASLGLVNGNEGQQNHNDKDATAMLEEIDKDRGLKVSGERIAVAAFGDNILEDAFPRHVRDKIIEIMSHYETVQIENASLADQLKNLINIKDQLEGEKCDAASALNGERRQVTELRLKIERITDEKRREATKALSELTELRKQVAHLKGMEASFQANLRRMEKENTRLRETLVKSQLWRNDSSNTQRGMTKEGVLGDVATKANIATDLEKKMCGPLRVQNTRLNRENALLKQILVEIEGQLADSSRKDADPSQSLRTEVSKGYENRLGHPVDWFCGDFKAAILDNISKLQDCRYYTCVKVSSPKDHVNSHCSTDSLGQFAESNNMLKAEELRKKLVEAEKTIAEQKAVIEKSIFGEGPPFSPHPQSQSGRQQASNRVIETPLSARYEKEDELEYRERELDRREERLAQMENKLQLAAEEIADRELLKSSQVNG